MKITDSYSDITNWFLETLQVLLEKQETVMVGLGGGSSFDDWYISLIQNTKDKVQNENELFNRIRWFVTDERVNCDTSDRNDAHIWEVFL